TRGNTQASKAKRGADGITTSKQSMKASGYSWDYVNQEIALLKLRLRRELRYLMRESGRSQLDQLQGLVVTEKEILGILTDRSFDVTESVTEIDAQIEQLEKQRASRFLSATITPALGRLSESFGLNRFEQQCLILCMAPEIEPKYSRAYAFLQDDVTQKLPTV